MIPEEARKDLETRLEEAIDVLQANLEALQDINVSDIGTFIEIVNSYEEEIDLGTETVKNCRVLLDE